jgi:hypothetical protein
MEALLAKNPTITVTNADSWKNTTGLSLTGTVALRARLNATDKAYAGGSLSASVAGKFERTDDGRTETGGQTRIIGDKNSTVARSIAGTVAATLSVVNHPPPQGGAGMGSPGLASLTRDFFMDQEKHGVTPFIIGNNKQDADIDRHYYTPKEVTAELQANREDWLARCIETLEPDATGNKDTLDNRARAAELLKTFEHEIEDLGQTSKFSTYNINYSMRPQAAAWIDSCRAVEALGAMAGDTDAAHQAVAACDHLLSESSTWRPLMLIARERGKDARDIGIDFVVRAQSTTTVESQRTAAQFPPEKPVEPG